MVFRVRTALTTPCFFDDVDRRNEHYLWRNIRYVNYYWPLREKMGFDDIWMFDNKSCQESVNTFKKYCPQVKLFQYDLHLEFNEEQPDFYPYCWRALHDLRVLMRMGYKKIICIDSDGYLNSERILEWVKTTNTGWQALWCPAHKFPDASMMILNEDAFSLHRAFCRTPWRRQLGMVLENAIPITGVETKFNADRFGIHNIPPPAREDIDYYGEASLYLKGLKFETQPIEELMASEAC